MSEAKFQAGLIKRLEDLFPGCVIMKNDANYRQGFPDLLILHNNQWATLECKAAINSSVQPNQEYWNERLNAMSFSAFVYPENEHMILDALVRYFI